MKIDTQVLARNKVFIEKRMEEILATSLIIKDTFKKHPFKDEVRQQAKLTKEDNENLWFNGYGDLIEIAFFKSPELLQPPIEVNVDEMILSKLDEIIVLLKEMK